MTTPFSSTDPPSLREPMTRRLLRRSVMTGQLTLPAVPGMIDEYVTMCGNVFAALGVRFTTDELVHLKAALAEQLAEAYSASPRSNIIISYDVPVGVVLNYMVRVEWQTIESAYENWISTREPPLFGTEPDARVWALAGEAADPRTFRVLDIGAGTGRNTLALARRGHPVDAVEMTQTFANGIRAAATQGALAVQVLQRDIFALVNDLHWDYRLIVASEVVSDFRTTEQ
ncbi:MAG: class I SAM-dependent methyltransferase, partial [Mycobacterium sp.]